MGEKTSARQRLEAFITGQVQGVGFRYWVRKQAEELGLTGTAANRSDGSVAVAAEGPPSDVAHLLDRLKSGSTPGRIDGLEASLGAATGEFDDFRDL